MVRWFNIIQIRQRRNKMIDGSHIFLIAVSVQIISYLKKKLDNARMELDQWRQTAIDLNNKLLDKG